MAKGTGEFELNLPDELGRRLSSAIIEKRSGTTIGHHAAGAAQYRAGAGRDRQAEHQIGVSVSRAKYAVRAAM